MRVIVTTDGSKQSLAGAKHLKSFADPARITEILVVAVNRPLAAVALADDLSELGHREAGTAAGTFRAAAHNALTVIATKFDGWGPKVHQRIRSGAPANAMIKAARAPDAGLVVIASGSRGLSETVLLGSTAPRVQHYAPCPVPGARCPVLVVRPAPRKPRKTAVRAKS